MSRRVLVVDDHAPFREAVRALLSASGYQVVGEAADGRTALDACERLRPDVVLLDVQLPDLDGFEVAARLAARAICPAVVLTSTRDEDAYRRRVRSAAVVGFIPKAEVSGAAMDALLG